LYGLVFLVATEGALFAYLLFSYFFLGSQAPGPWPPSGAPPLLTAAVNTGILLASSVTAWWGQGGIEKGASGRLLTGLSATFVLGAVFAGVQIHEWLGKTFTPATDAYGSLFFTITGVHIAHVVVGLIILICLITWTLLGRFTAQRHLHVTVGVLYWHFVDAVWLAVFAALFLTPRLG
jgi:heme/copper-type cytochrome/quinol oxidase subunit 3